MTNEVQVFNFEQMNVRTVEINDEVWFVATDVANALNEMDFSIGSTGVADLHHSFAPAKEFDIETERKRILKHNGRLEHRTTWVTPGENQVQSDEYESRYQVFKKMRDAGKSPSEIASAIGVSEVTLSSIRYRGRYQKENA